jgi:hypothetical protein
MSEIEVVKDAAPDGVLAPRIELSPDTMRVFAEVKGGMMLAREFPRSQIKARADVMRLCDSIEFAQHGFYSYPRGVSTVVGPSAPLMRAIAGSWGNLWTTSRVVKEDDKTATVEAIAWDVESGRRASRERTFGILIQRNKQWVKPDERDKLELYSREGAKALRDAIREIIPADLTEDAFKACMARVAKGGDDRVPREKRIAMWVKALSLFGVTTAMIETKYGSKVDDLSNEQVAELVGIHKALSDGEARRDEFFSAEAAPGVVKVAAVTLGPATVTDRGASAKPEPAKEAQQTTPAAKPAEMPAPEAQPAAQAAVEAKHATEPAPWEQQGATHVAEEQSAPAKVTFETADRKGKEEIVIALIREREVPGDEAATIKKVPRLSDVDLAKWYNMTVNAPLKTTAESLE